MLEFGSNRPVNFFAAAMASIPVACLFYLIVASFSGARPHELLLICKAAAFGVAFFLQATAFSSRFNNSGACILFATLTLAVFSILPGNLFPAYWIGIVLSLYPIFKNFGSITLKSFFAALTLFTFFNVIVLTVYFNLPYAQPFNEGRLLRGQIHTDTLYHSSVAAMIKVKSIVSHGLHGTTPLEYHFGSHVLIAAMSKVAQTSIWEAYSFFYPFVFVPLLGVSIICLSEEFLSSQSFRWLIVRVAMFIFATIGMGILSSGSILNRFALWPSFYESESYCLSLIYLVGVMSLIRSRVRVPWHITVLLLTIFVAVGTIAKISTGAFAVGLIGLAAVFKKDSIFEERPRAVRYITGVFIGVIFVLVSPYVSPIESAGKISPLQFILDYVKFSGPLYWGVTQFAVLHFIFPFLVFSFLVFYHRRLNPVAPLWLILGLLGTTLLGAIMILSLRIQGGSAYYFSNPSMFVALPIFLAIPEFTSRFAKNRYSRTVVLGVQGAIVLFGFFRYSGEPVMSGFRTFRVELAQPLVNSVIGQYAEQLRRVRAEDPKGSRVVYISRAEPYWQNIHCNAASFFITAISEHPALYAWPNKTCFDWLCGERFHAGDLCQRSQLSYSDVELLEEAVRLGYDGVDIISQQNHRYVHK